MDAYETHRPVLRKLGVLPVERVVEFGVGLYSTPTFLDRADFPHLTSLVSYENSPEWYEKIAFLAARDPRADLHLIDRQVSDMLADGEIDLAAADLVFIDHGLTNAERTRTFGLIAERQLAPSALVVMHDWEWYRPGGYAPIDCDLPPYVEEFGYSHYMAQGGVSYTAVMWWDADRWGTTLFPPAGTV